MKLKISIKSSFEEVDRAAQIIKSFMEQNLQNADKRSIFIIVFSLRELLNNAVEHGNDFDFNKDVYCDFSIEGRRITIEVKDQGSGFDIDMVRKRITEKEFLSERTRGISTLENIGFKIDVNDNAVIASVDIDKIKVVRK